MQKKLVAIIAFLFVGVIMVSPFLGMAQAAQISLSNGQSPVKKDATFKVNITIDPKGESLDTARVVISYPQGLLSVTSFTPSVMFPNQSPGSTFNNNTGTLSWGGYTTGSPITSRGVFGTITFKALASGVARISVSGQSHLISAGTDLVDASSLGSVLVTIEGDRPATPPVTPNPTPVPTPVPTPTPTPTTPSPAPAPSPTPTPTPVQTGLPYAPTVTSSTHPDSNKWYSANDVILSWRMAAGTTGVNFLANQVPIMDPLGPADAFSSTHTYKDVKDGVWYFHINLQNAKGWGPASHFKFQIDSTAPTAATVNDVIAIEDGRAAFSIQAQDNLSGIDRYTISIDGGFEQEWRDDGTHTFTTPVLEAGQHQLTVIAHDAAGNIQTTTHTFTVKEYVKTPTPAQTVTPTTTEGKEYPLITLEEIQWITAGVLAAMILIKLALMLMRRKPKLPKLPPKAPSKTPPAPRKTVATKSQKPAVKSTRAKKTVAPEIEKRTVISGKPTQKRVAKKKTVKKASSKA